MADGERKVTIPINGSSMAAVLWIGAIGLLVWDVIHGASGHLGRAGVLLGLIATCLTLNALMRHHRRVLLEVISYEFQMRDERKPVGDLPQQPGTVTRPFRTRVD